MNMAEREADVVVGMDGRESSPLLFFFFFPNVYLFLGQRETEHERGRGRERGRHRIGDRKSTRLNSSHSAKSRMPSSA